MENNKLYSVSGLFDSPDKIISAVKNISDLGYKKYDVHTPYPLHGMDQAMKLKPSMMGYFALAFGLTGTALAILLMTFTSVFDYPLNLGGKPSFALPAFIPITFELTVLMAAIGTVFALLFVFFKMPYNSHPLHDSNYMKRCTSDRFGLTLEAKDPLFDIDNTTKLLENLGAVNVENIYFEKEEKVPIFTKGFIVFLLVTAFIIGGATYFSLNKLVYYQPFNWMQDQARIDVESKSDFFKDGFGMREPVKGTVARGFIPEEFKDEPEKAGNFLINPLKVDKQNISLGKSKFLIYCSPCHGNFAKGNSRLKTNFPKPPSLHSNKVRNWPDGRIYHVVTFGKGIMPSYAKQVTRKERWAIILYLRTLQRAFNPMEEDFNESK